LGNKPKSCEISTTPTVITFSGNAPVGLKGGSIGIATKTDDDKGSGQGQSCSQVSANEQLTLSLNTNVSWYAVLDVEVQKDAVIVATPKKAGVAGTPFVLLSGNSTTSPPAGLPAGAITSTCSVSTSSGPNSNISDNCRWVLDGGLFDTLQLKAVKGQFSLEGGADGANIPSTAPERAGTPAIVSYFLLSVPCTPANSTVSISGSTIVGDDASFTRSTTNTDGSSCLTVPTSLSRDGDGDLVLTKPALQPFSQGVVKVPFLANPGTDDATNTIEGNFLPNKAESGWVTLPWCPAALFDADGVYQPLSGVPSNAAAAATYLTGLGLKDQDKQTATEGINNNLFQTACVLGRSVTFVPGATPTFKTVDSVYILGDWYGR
jgi:hypothetical protein